MAKKKGNGIHQIDVYFTPEGFLIDDLIMDRMEEQKDFLDWYEKFQNDKYLTLFQLGFLTKQEWFSPALEYLYVISDMLIKTLSRQPGLELERGDIKISLTDEDINLLIEEVPFVIGMECVDKEWLESVFNQILHQFSKEIKKYEGTVSMYFTENNARINVAGRVFFHLVENKQGSEPFAFMATYSNKSSKSKKTIHTPLKHALKEFEGEQKKMLTLISTVVRAAEQSDFISDLLESGELFSPIHLTAKEAYTFLREIELYESVGIMCRVPDWWRKKTNSIRLSVTVGEKEPSQVGLDAIMDFKPSLSLDGEVLSEQELSEFLDMAEGLIMYKGKWVEINKEKLEAVLEAYDKVVNYYNTSDLTLGDAMRMELNLNQAFDIDTDEVEMSVTNGQWLKHLKYSMSQQVDSEQVEIAPSFEATLRGYQENGYQWLQKMYSLGLGVCLADDMGLGKTVQMIALLEHLRVIKGGKVLLILPASLIGNWEKEIQKFAPKMSYQVLHRSAIKGSEELLIDSATFLCITTYGMAVRMDSLKSITWDLLVLDEAQAIKNPGTKQTKNIKAIPARTRIAMTGTPIENRLGDLWSLFDFLNQGLLGNAKEFKAFTKALKEDVTGYQKLRKIISPFMLRRLKTDKSIIADLPEKVEINEYTALSKRQVALYKKLLKDIAKKLEEAEGIERKGLVLSSIMKFKQICNHPDQYLGKEDYKPVQSGKFEQLRSICQTIYEKRERVLIFTQFREMTEPLSAFLTDLFEREGLVLHGGTSVKKRTKMVEAFNGEHYVPYMVLSLKAGGVGLNLTGANHVIHFDRWWNPAVENQATDRAFRIGQTKNVMVHKFVTQGTIEERIDEMITKKQSLAKNILSSGEEQWITELNNEELMTLFKLEGA